MDRQQKQLQELMRKKRIFTFSVRIKMAPTQEQAIATDRMTGSNEQTQDTNNPNRTGGDDTSVQEGCEDSDRVKSQFDKCRKTCERNKSQKSSSHPNLWVALVGCFGSGILTSPQRSLWLYVMRTHTYHTLSYTAAVYRSTGVDWYYE